MLKAKKKLLKKIKQQTNFLKLALKVEQIFILIEPFLHFSFIFANGLVESTRTLLH